MTTVKAGIVGVTGYAGGELARLLVSHPAVELAFCAAGTSSAGRALGDALPALRGFSALTVAPVPETPERWPALDVLFLCLPHGESAALVSKLPQGPVLIDLGNDHRLDPSFVYGLCENARESLAGAKKIANPGCFASACILALSPLVAARLIEPRVVIDAKTGSSGSGAKPGAGTHHPERSEGFTAYKPFKHQHVPEIKAALAALDPAWGNDVLLQTHSAPMIRGIYATAYAKLHAGAGEADVKRAFAAHYAAASFVRLVDGPPNVHWVRGSNFTDLGYAVDGRDVIVFAALDNLGKGAAGQAVQNMNLALGLPETAGLWHAGAYP